MSFDEKIRLVQVDLLDTILWVIYNILIRVQIFDPYDILTGARNSFLLSCFHPNRFFSP